jgi:hypothetical protein
MIPIRFRPKAGSVLGKLKMPLAPAGGRFTMGNYQSLHDNQAVLIYSIRKSTTRTTLQNNVSPIR